MSSIIGFLFKQCCRKINELDYINSDTYKSVQNLLCGKYWPLQNKFKTSKRLND